MGQKKTYNKSLLVELWERDGGIREVLKLAAPLMITNGAWALMLFVDRLILFKSSVDEFNAALPAGTLYWLAMALFVGIASYANTFVAQYYGADKPERIGASVWQGIRIGVYATPIFLLLIPLAPLYFQLTTKDSAVAGAEITYFQILMFGCTSAVIATAQGAFFNGRGETTIVMLVNIGAVILNILLDYLLVLGNWGFPKMGIKGAGVATTVASWAMVGTFFYLMSRNGNWKKYHLNTTWKHDGELLRRMFKFGTPNGLPMLLEAVTFHALVKIVLVFGTIKAAASSLVLSINQLAHFPLVGLGIACSILVGQKAAKSHHSEARTAIFSALIVGLVYCLFFAILYFFLPDAVIGFHREVMTGDGAFFSIREVAVILLQLAALYLVVECIQLVFSGAIKGAGDTWYVLYITVLSAIITLVGYFVAKSIGLYAMWWVYILQIVIISIACIKRFIGGKWKNLSVIETKGALD